jgi:hypothetical protein
MYAIVGPTQFIEEEKYDAVHSCECAPNSWRLTLYFAKEFPMGKKSLP